MRSKLFLGLTFIGATAFGVTAGCGSDDETSGGAGAASSASGSSTGSAITTSTTASSSASASSSSGLGGGSGGDGNDSFETAVELMPDNAETLSPTGDQDFFVFDGTKDQVVWLFITDAQADNDAQFDPSWIDTVITLYDESKTQIAENNDRQPRRSNDSELFTILPATGKYYVRVTECHSWASNPSDSCQLPADKDNVSYSLAFREPDAADEGWVADTEMGNDAASAEPVDYSAAPSGGYYLTGLWGAFTDAADIDVFSFTIPPDTPFVNRSTVSFRLLPSGTNGNGSTTPMGKVWIADAALPDMAIALVDGTQQNRMTPPLEVAHPYLFFVEHPGTVGSHDFYFTLHGVGDSNTLELTDPGGNDLSTTPEPVEVVANGALYSAFFEGDIANAPADIDHFIADVPAGLDPQTKLRLACEAQRGGSGLRSMKGTLMTGAGISILNGSAVEQQAKDFSLTNVALPAGATQIIVRIEAASQDPLVSSTFYRCGLHFAPP